MASNILVKRISTILFIGFLFSACTRIGTTEMGLGLLPSMDAFNTKDTLLDVETETIDRPDSARIYGQDDQVVGIINNDPLFGSTTASMYFQLKPGYFPFYLRGSKDSIAIDSAVLILSYKGFYGDSTKPVVLNLKRISTTSPLNLDTLVASNYPEVYNIQTDATMANPFTLDFDRVRDSVNNRFEQAKDQIQVFVNIFQGLH